MKAEIKNLDQVREEIAKVKGAIVVMEAGLYAALDELQVSGLTAVRTVHHARGEYQETRPAPALRTQRELIASLRALRRHMADLRKEEAALASAKAVETSHWAQFAQKGEKRES